MTSNLLLCIVAGWLSVSQAVPPPGDGDIRVLYWELTKETEVWLTLEPKSPDGKPLPTAMNLTLTLRFSGKRPKAPPEQVEMRANAGMLWAPRVELWVLLDDRDKIDLTPPGAVSLATGMAWDYLPTPVPISTLHRIAQANRVTGNALGVDFELTASQRQAIRTFIDRAISDNPGQFGR